MHWLLFFLIDNTQSESGQNVQFVVRVTCLDLFPIRTNVIRSPCILFVVVPIAFISSSDLSYIHFIILHIFICFIFLYQEFPWHPKPVNELTGNAAIQLNESACLVLFTGNQFISLAESCSDLFWSHFVWCSFVRLSFCQSVCLSINFLHTGIQPFLQNY